jgi:hypothetical protein
MCVIELNRSSGVTVEANAAGFLVLFSNDADTPLFCAGRAKDFLGDTFKLTCISFSFPSEYIFYVLSYYLLVLEILRRL